VFTKNPMLTVVASPLIGSLSFEFIETPIRSRNFLKSNRRLIWCCACVEGLICLTGYLTYSRLESMYAEVAIHKATAGPIPNPPPGANCQTLGVPGVAKFVLWGDSHAMPMAKLIDEMARARGISGQCFSAAGIPPLLGTWNNELHSSKAQISWNRS